MTVLKFKCLIKMGRGGTAWRVIQAKNSLAAREEFTMLYGKENMKSGIFSAK